MPLLSPLLGDVLTPPGGLDRPILPLVLAPHGLLPKLPAAACKAGVQHCTSLEGCIFLGTPHQAAGLTLKKGGLWECSVLGPWVCSWSFLASPSIVPASPSILRRVLRWLWL